MTQTADHSNLKTTPFHAYHLEQDGKMVPFAGWEMPIHYGSILDEHHQCRNSGGLFDVSHMGRLRFTGRDACRFLDRICTRQIAGMPDGSARYSFVCNEAGGCKDDVLVYRISDGEYVMVCNASNREKLLSHIDNARSEYVFKMKDETESTGMVAVQGPKVIELLSRFSSEVPTLKRFRFLTKSILFAKIMISRTGYTGEDGVEIILPASLARKAINLMLSKLGDDADAVKPCGLGARDSLRLEAAMPLYGHELSEDRNVLETGLGFAMKLDKAEDDEKSPASVGRFIGQDALQEIAAKGVAQKLVGIAIEGRRAARQEMSVAHDGKGIGVVTSGCWSPTLERSIAMAYVDADLSAEGTNVTIDLGRATAKGTIVKLPFYSAGK
ncbi:MAG: glycine cleavage system aminomethyltransferase GcvT [Phycisphaerales bacterium]